MSHLLIVSSAAALLLGGLALALSLAARLPRLADLAAGTVATIAAMATALVYAVAGLFLWKLADGPAWGMPFALAVALAALGLTLFARRPLEEGGSRAASWSLPRLAVLVLLALVVLVTSARDARLANRQRIDARRSELAALEQIWWPGVPASLNAAPLYRDAYRSLIPLAAVPGAPEAYASLWDSPDAPARSSEAPPLHDWVAKNQRTLALAGEAAKKPGYASVEDALWRGNPLGVGRESKIFRLETQRAGHDPQTVDNQLSRRRVGDLFATRALQRLAAGDAPGAIDDANSLFALADQTGSRWLRPERVLPRLALATPMTAAALARLAIPRGAGLDTTLQRTLVREEHAELTWMGGDLRGFNSATVVPRDSVDAVFLWPADIFAAGVWDARLERRYDLAWEAVESSAAGRFARLREALPPEGDGSGLRYVPFLLGFLEENFTEQARLDCARAGLAVARYRLEHQQFPEKLINLVPDYLEEVPADPFDGQPLRYRAAGPEARVYSVGPDLRDDGGAEELKAEQPARNPRTAARTGEAVNGGGEEKRGDLAFVLRAD